jgi:hypothetical protein
MKIRRPLAIDWTTKAKEWVDAGLISPDAASAIVSHEGIRLAKSPNNPYEGSLSPLAEVLAYVAMIFTVASGATLVERTFPTYGVRTLSLALVAVATLALGSRVMRLGGHAWERIGGVLLAFGTACSGGLAALVLTHYAKLSSDTTQLLTALLVTTLSWALWRNRERFFQMVTTIGGLYWFIGSAIGFSNVHLKPWIVTLLFWAAGMLVVLLRTSIHPTQGALYVGMAVALIAAPTLLADSSQGYLYGSLFGIPVVGEHAEGGKVLLQPAVVSGLALIAVIIGVGIAIAKYQLSDVDSVAPQNVSVFTRVARKDLMQDSFNEAVFMKPGQALTALLVKGDDKVIDGAVRGVAATALGTGSTLRKTQTGFARSYAAFILIGAIVLIAGIWVVTQ